MYSVLTIEIGTDLSLSRACGSTVPAELQANLAVEQEPPFLHNTCLQIVERTTYLHSIRSATVATVSGSGDVSG